jgi:putative flippase GtrA
MLTTIGFRRTTERTENGRARDNSIVMTALLVKPSRFLKNAPRFAVVGALGLVVNMLGLQLLYRAADLPLLIASALSAELATVQNCFLNGRWTFGHRRPSFVRFVRFNLSFIVALLVNVALVWALVASGTHYLLANLAGIAVGATWNFSANSSWKLVEGKA